MEGIERIVEDKKRIEWIDILRAFAILAVILCHATEGIYKLNIESVTSMSIMSKFTAFTGFTLGRTGVPVFLMISGYLLLDREYDKTRTIRFWKNNWLKLLLCTEICFFVYELFLNCFFYQKLEPGTIIEDLLFVHKVNMGHVWYMPMILGMYVLIPFVASALKSFDVSVLKFPIVFFCAIAFGYPFVNVVNNAFQGEPLSLQLSTGFSGGAYGLYMVLGYMVKKGAFKNIKTSLVVVTGIVSFACAVGFQIWAYSRGCVYNVWYDCPFIMIAALMFFECGSRIKRVRLYGAVKLVSYYSFPLYLIHFMIRLLLLRYMADIEMMRCIKVLVVWTVSFVASLMIAVIINKIPRVGKLVLNTK